MNGLATKEQLVGKFFEALKITRAGAGIREMELDGDYVIIHYEGGINKVPVACDSGVALMRDVLKHIG